MAQAAQARPLVLDIFGKSRYGKIDRRKATRTVPMKVLCLGLSRTGTQSLRQALFELGYDDVYHATSVNIDSPRDTSMWLEAMNAKFEQRGKQFERRDWDQLLGHCMAVTDVPCVMFWGELADAYPEAKIILTVRDDAEQWYQSFMKSIMSLLANLYENTWLSWLRSKFPINPKGDKYAEMILKHEPSYREGHRDFIHGTKDGIRAYDRHNEAVITYAARNKRQLLVFNVKRGWSPLCSFLDLNRPKTPFPRLNDKRYYDRGRRKIFLVTLISVFVLASLYVFPILLAGYAFWWHKKASRVGK